MPVTEQLPHQYPLRRPTPEDPDGDLDRKAVAEFWAKAAIVRAKMEKVLAKQSELKAGYAEIAASQAQLAQSQERLRRRFAINDELLFFERLAHLRFFAEYALEVFQAMAERNNWWGFGSFAELLGAIKERRTTEKDVPVKHVHKVFEIERTVRLSAEVVASFEKLEKIREVARDLTYAACNIRLVADTIMHPQMVRCLGQDTVDAFKIVFYSLFGSMDGVPDGYTKRLPLPSYAKEYFRDGRSLVGCIQ